MKYFIMVGLVGLVVAFQNCSGKSFSARTDLNKALSVESEQLVEEEIPEDIVADMDDDVVRDDDNEEEDDEYVDNEDEDENDDDDDDDDKDEPKKYGDRGDDDDDDDYDRGNVVVKDDKRQRTSCKDRKDGNARFVCVLAGAGKSTHVAVTDGEITANNSTPKTACMSERACEDIIGNKMEVKSVESRGYCKNGTPQVLMLSDADIQRLMNKVQ